MNVERYKSQTESFSPCGSARKFLHSDIDGALSVGLDNHGKGDLLEWHWHLRFLGLVQAQAQALRLLRYTVSLQPITENTTYFSRYPKVSDT